MNYNEINTAKGITLRIEHPKTDWREWIKTIGILESDTTPYSIIFRGSRYSFELDEKEDAITVLISQSTCKENPLFVKLLKNVFRKAACCVGCRECEADCHNGCLTIENGKVTVSNECRHCAECHKVDKGCLIYKSIEMPKGGFSMKQKSLNCYSHFGPKIEWINQYFMFKNEFDANHDLGSQMYSFFKRFLRDAELIDINGFSRFAKVVERIGLDDEASWALMLTNLAYTPQIGWFVTHTGFNELYERNYILSLLVDDGAKESWVNDIWSAYSRFTDLPFSNVGLGIPHKDSGKFVGFTRTSWLNPEPKVVLYALYKFSEACDNYRQFTLTRLLNREIESDGISPTQIFGLDRTTMERILNGLANNYPEFISVSFTLDLDNINLKDKTSDDVLSLFEGV